MRESHRSRQRRRNALCSLSFLDLNSGLNLLTLNGRLISYANNVTALGQLGVLFTNYINSVESIVIGKGVSVTKADGSVVTWLQTGITQLTTTIPFLPPQPIDPIKGITIDYISLVYNEATPYNPILFSNDLVGQFALPFGFSLNIVELATEITIFTNGANVGTATGPYSTSNTNISTLSTGQTAGQIFLTLPPSQLILPNTTVAAKQQLIEFQDAFVYMSSSAFQAVGAAKALTDTPVGQILLNGIKFGVTTGLVGLNGLTTYPTIIDSVDVTGGTPDATSLAVGLTLVNPSNLNLSVGDTTFQLSNEGVFLGNATLADLHLSPGENSYISTAFFDPNVAPIGLETLNRFIAGLDTQLNITGFAGSSPIESLAASLIDIKLNSTLPGLTKNLVVSANLTVLPTTGVTNNVANSIVYLANPFSSAITITSITATASSHGIYLADIDTQLVFPAAGKATSASPNVPLTINLYPPDLFGLLRALAVDAGLNPTYIDGLVQLAGYTLTPTTSADAPTTPVGSTVTKRDSFVDEEDNVMAQRLMGVGSNAGILDGMFEDNGEDEVESDGIAKRANGLVYSNLDKRDNIYTGFNLANYVLQAFAGARADLVITSNALIGEYGTTLTFSQNDVPLGTDQTLLLLLPPVALPIVQQIVDKSILNIDRVTITEPQPGGFVASLQGALTNSGPFDAVVSFPTGLDIFWEGQLLTSTAFPDITLTGDLGSSINVQLQGSIPDIDYFTTFLKAAITGPSFVWTIRGSGLSVAALGITVPGISITKEVQLTGLNGLAGNVIINSFDVPSNDPAGGLSLTADTTIYNPAQVGVTLSSFATNIFDGAVLIGPAASTAPFTLQALAVTSLPLAGRLVQQTTPEGLAALSNIFTRFVANQNTPLTVNGVSAGPADVAWLNNGITALSVAVVLPAQSFEVIRLISLNALALYFTVPTAYSPITDSSNTTANFFLPFAFPFDITTISGPFTLNYNNADMAVLNIPTSPATTNVEARVLTLMFSNVPLAVGGSAHTVFNDFVADFTKNVQVTVDLKGTADALANTAAGALTITGIPFNLNTNLLGLQNLNARPANVSNLDVVHGYPTYLEITVDTALYNPSDTLVSAGDVSFGVLFQEDLIGQALINNIVLAPGENTVPTQINYMPMGGTNIASGQLLLENYVQNVTSAALVAGSDQTTPIPSLVKGLSGISLNTNIPPLEKLIVVSTFLEVPKNIAQDGGVASVNVFLANPFTASINILNLQAAANFDGITVGTINTNLAATNNIFSAPGKVTTESNAIPFNINIDPKNLIRFIEAAAATYGVSLGPLPPYLGMVLNEADTTTTISPFPDSATPPCNSGKAFDTLGAILALVKPLAVSIPIQSTLKLDDYQTNLDFIQQPVPVQTDNSILYLVGPAAAPLIQLIVNAATLVVSTANATNLVNDGFDVSLLGSLGVDSPADAYIEFPDGVTVNFQGTDIASLTLSPICSQVPDGVPVLTNTGHLTILDQGAFANFAYYLLTEPNFQWFLHSNTVIVRALGIVFSNVILEKTIQLDAFNGIPGLRITEFSAPSDAPGQINILATTPITSLASLGVELDNASFQLFFQGSNIGQITSDLLFLTAKATTNAMFTGFLSNQANNPTGLANVGILFSQFLAGQDSTLTIRGLSVVTRANGNQPVSWLTTAFKRFTDNVVLPGHIYQIIFSITLSDLTVTVENNAVPYSIPSSNNYTLATFSNPFGFHLQPLAITPLITLTYLGVNTAQINLPSTNVVAGTSNAPTDIQPITFGFRNIPITSLNDNQFALFFAKLADTNVGNFGLMGSTSVVAKTEIGNPLITGIPFNVQTQLVGINSFNGAAPLSDVQVNAPTTAYIGINLLVALENPSNITLFTEAVSLPTYFVTNNALIGRATIPQLNLYPGANTVMSLFEFMIPGNSSEVQQVLSLYLQPADLVTAGDINNIPLRIQGGPSANPVLTPYPVLDPALQGVLLTTNLAGIGTRIVQNIRVYIPASVLIEFLVSTLGTLAKIVGVPVPASQQYVYVFLDAVNDLPSQISFVQLSSTVRDTTNPNGPIYAQFTMDFSNSFILPAATTTNQPSTPLTTSPQINNVLLTQGLAGSLSLVGHNLNTDNYVQVDLSAPGANGGDAFRIPGLHYQENNINTTYFLSAGAGDAGVMFGCLLTATTPAQILACLVSVLGSLPDGLTGLLDALGALNTANPSAVIQSIVGIAGIGPLLSPLLCTTEGALGLFGTAACDAPTASSTSANVLSTAASVATSAVGAVTGAAGTAVAGVTSALPTSIIPTSIVPAAILPTTTTPLVAIPTL
jgi:hypothetical protein